MGSSQSVSSSICSSRTSSRSIASEVSMMGELAEKDIFTVTPSKVPHNELSLKLTC
jgi:hypothetical protein